jgi:glutamyl-tRNA synthetase
MTNYLALLGWGPPDGVEVRPIEEIVQLFDLGDVNPSPAMFDLKKLRAVNGDWIRMMTPDQFTEAGSEVLARQPWADRVDQATWAQIAPQLQTRLAVMTELPDQVDFLFLDEPVVDAAAWEKAIGSNEAADAILDATIAAYGDVAWDADALHSATAALAEAAALKLGKFQAPIRVALTGRTVGPPLFEAMVVLGREKTLERLRAARAALAAAGRG